MAALAFGQRLRDAARVVADPRRRTILQRIADDVVGGEPCEAWEGALLLRHLASERVAHEPLRQLCVRRMEKNTDRRCLHHMAVACEGYEEWAACLHYARRLGAVHAETRRDADRDVDADDPTAMYDLSSGSGSDPVYDVRSEEAVHEAATEQMLDVLPATSILHAARQVMAGAGLSDRDGLQRGASMPAAVELAQARDALHVLATSITQHPLGYDARHHAQLWKLWGLVARGGGVPLGAAAARAHARLCQLYADSGFVVLFDADEAAAVLVGLQRVHAQTPRGHPEERAAHSGFLPAAGRLLDVALAPASNLPAAAQALHVYLAMQRDTGTVAADPRALQRRVDTFVARVTASVNSGTDNADTPAHFTPHETVCLINVAGALLSVPVAGRRAIAIRSACTTLMECVGGREGDLSISVLCRALRVYRRLDEGRLERGGRGMAQALRGRVVGSGESLDAAACIEVMGVLEAWLAYEREEDAAHPKAGGTHSQWFAAPQAGELLAAVLRQWGARLPGYLAATDWARAAANLARAAQVAAATRADLPAVFVEEFCGRERAPVSAAVAFLGYATKAAASVAGRVRTDLAATCIRHIVRHMVRDGGALTRTAALRVVGYLEALVGRRDHPFDDSVAYLGTILLRNLLSTPPSTSTSAAPRETGGGTIDVPAMHVALQWIHRVYLPSGRAEMPLTATNADAGARTMVLDRVCTWRVDMDAVVAEVSRRLLLRTSAVGAGGLATAADDAAAGGPPVAGKPVYHPLPPRVLLTLLRTVCATDAFGDDVVSATAMRLRDASVLAAFTLQQCAAVLATLRRYGGLAHAHGGPSGEIATLGILAAVERRVLHLIPPASDPGAGTTTRTGSTPGTPSSDGPAPAPTPDVLVDVVSAVAALQAPKSVIARLVPHVVDACAAHALDATQCVRFVQSMHALRVYATAAGQVAASPRLRREVRAGDAAAVLHCCATMQTATSEVWGALGERVLRDADGLSCRAVLDTVAAVRLARAGHPVLLEKLARRILALQDDTDPSSEYRRLHAAQQRLLDDFVVSQARTAASGGV